MKKREKQDTEEARDMCTARPEAAEGQGAVAPACEQAASKATVGAAR